MYPLSAKQYQSMAKMRAVQPRIEALKERYGDDKQQFQIAMMELYKKEKINPIGGCLPMLIPIPIFLGLYWVLLETVELRHAPWIGWIQNLTAPDPYFILPALNLIVMYLTQKLTPMPGMDPMQKKMMQFMPLVFGVMMAFFPSGLVLYWVTNGVLGLLQQWWMTKRKHGREDRGRRPLRRVSRHAAAPAMRLARHHRRHRHRAGRRAASASCACPGRAPARIGEAISGRRLQRAPRAPRALPRCRRRDPSTTASRSGSPRPRSYTGEDVVELQAHGSPMLLAQLLRAACSWARARRARRVHRTRVPRRQARPGPGRSGRRPDRRRQRWPPRARRGDRSMASSRAASMRWSNS